MSDHSYITETIAPTDQAAVAEAVHNAVDRQLAVYPVGGGTMLDYGVAPTRPGIALSMAQLNRVIDYPAADMTITVEAGMTIADLSKQLASQGQRLPIDVAQPQRATVGGALAVDALGPRRYAYGTMRDYVLGLTIVDGAGVAFNAGGSVVKNAAGYNLCRLMVGSLGTLGVVAQATLMVRPQCEASVFLVCEASDFTIAEKLLAHLVSSPTRPVAVELVAGRQNENDLVLGPMLEGNVGRLYVGFEGAMDEVDWMVEQLRGRWASIGATAPMVIPTSRAESLWRWLTEFSGNVQISLLPSALIQTINNLLEIEPGCAIHAHAGDGVIRVKMGQWRELASANIARMRAIAQAAGGTMILRKPIDGVAMTVEDVWGEPGPEMRVMQAMKERFDPKNMLNSGRFVFE